MELKTFCILNKQFPARLKRLSPVDCRVSSVETIYSLVNRTLPEANVGIAPSVHPETKKYSFGAFLKREFPLMAHTYPVVTVATYCENRQDF